MSDTTNHLLRQLRFDRGLTYSGLAAEVNLSASLLAQVERGELPMSPRTAKRLGSFFNVRPSELAGVATTQAETVEAAA